MPPSRSSPSAAGPPPAEYGLFPTWGDAYAARDWDRFRSLYADDAVIEDHRPMGRGRISADEYTESTRALTELAPDSRFRFRHVIVGDNWTLLIVNDLVGEAETGPFEIAFVSVAQQDDDGRIVHTHMFDLEQLPEARARFEELSRVGSSGEIVPPNAATRCARGNPGRLRRAGCRALPGALLGGARVRGSSQPRHAEPR